MKHRRGLSFLMAALLTVSTAICSITNAFAADIRSMTAQELVNDMKIGWNLGNTLDSSDITWISNPTPTQFETAWGNPVTTKAMIKSVKDAGFNTIRIPTTWGEKTSGSNYTISSEWMSRVKEVVDYAIDYDMYVILNIHHENSWLKPTSSAKSATKNQLTKIWTQIANNFKNYDEHLIFETMNEPRLVGDATEWTGGTSEARAIINEYNVTALDAIRATGGNNTYRFVMAPTHAASATANAINDFVVPNNDSRVIVSVHMYTPYNFAMNPSGTSSWGSSSDKSALDSELDLVYNRFVSKGIPVVIGEFGTINKNNESARAAHAEYFVSAARKRGITPVWWDNNAFNQESETYGIFERSTLTWKFPSILSGLMKGAGTQSNINTNINSSETVLFSGNASSSSWGQAVSIPVSNLPSLSSSDKIAVSYSSSNKPELILQRYSTSEWVKINPDSVSGGIAYFNYSTIKSSISGSISNYDVLYIGDTGASLTVTRVAIVGSTSATTTTTKATTTTTTTKKATTTTTQTTTKSSNVSGALSAGTYSASSILSSSQFTVSGSTSTSQIKIGTDGYVQFAVNSGATVTVNYKCGSSSSSKSAYVKLNGQSGTSLAGGAGSADLKVSGLSADTYKITAGQSGGTTAQIVSITVAYSSSATTTTKATTTTTKATTTTTTTKKATTTTTQTTTKSSSSSTGSIANGWYYIKNVNSNKYLSVENNDGYAGANVCQNTGSGVAGQKWYVQNDGSGYYTLKSGLGEYNLDVNGWGTSDGTNIALWDVNNYDCQKFEIREISNGQYAILTKLTNSEKGLDVYDISTEDGANICQWSYWGGAGQLFRFESISASGTTTKATTTTTTTKKATTTTTQTTTKSSSSSSKSWSFSNSGFSGLGTISSNVTVDGLTLVANSSKTMKIKDNYLALSGAGNTSYRAIKVPVSGSGTVKVNCKSSGSSTRTLNVTNSSGSVIGTISAGTSAATGSVNFSNQSGYIYIYSAGSGINVFSVSIS